MGDPLAREITSSDSFQIRLHNIAARIDCPWPSTIAEINNHKLIVDSDLWARCCSQGKWVSDFREDMLGNSWLSHPGLLSEGQYIRAFKLRSNTSEVRVDLIRSGHGTPAVGRNCSLCPETQAHVLGQFVSTKLLRIGRHDAVVLKVMDRLMFNRMNIVYREQNFGCRRPDLVLVSDDQHGYIIDVTVRYEQEGTLQAAAVEKIEKYDPLRTVISVMYPELRDGCVVPFVFDSRGCVPSETLG
jgi:hypothetical protein